MGWGRSFPPFWSAFEVFICSSISVLSFIFVRRLCLFSFLVSLVVSFSFREGVGSCYCYCCCVVLRPLGVCQGGCSLVVSEHLLTAFLVFLVQFFLSRYIYIYLSLKKISFGLYVRHMDSKNVIQYILNDLTYNTMIFNHSVELIIYMLLINIKY